MSSFNARFVGLALVVIPFSIQAKGTFDSRLKFSSEESKERFCASRNSSDLIKERFFDPNERMSFDNGPYGVANGGICWWHSRFQRNALYLANFEPDAPKPSPQEVKRIIRRLRSGRDVVSIPGYANLREFSAENKDEIVRQLENWQLKDSVVNQRWINGLSGRTSSAQRLKKEMDEVYERVAVKKQLTYVKVQLPGIAAHALVIGDIKKTPDGYEFKAIDSNSAGETITYMYKEGSSNLTLMPANFGEDTFVPYVEFTKEVDRMERVLASTCGGFGKDNDMLTCSPENTPDEDEYAEDHIFNPSSFGLDLSKLGAEESEPEDGGGDCSSRSISPKKDSFDLKSKGYESRPGKASAQ